MLRGVVRTGIVVGLAAGLIAMSGGISAIAAAHRGSALAWRVNAVITRPGNATLLTVDAIGRRDAWAGGCATTAISGQGSMVPLIEHFAGKSWHRVATPAKLIHGCVRFIRSSSRGNVWAVGWDEAAHFSFSAFALHLVRGRWTIAHRWGPKIVDGGLPVGAAVLGRSSVWVFFEDNIIKHYNGHAWVTTSIPGENFLAAASADSGGGIWVAGEFSDMAYHLRVIGGAAHWLATSFAGVLHFSGTIKGIYARTPDDVWVTGSADVKTAFRPVMAHYTGGRWRRVNLRGHFALGGATSDGPHSLWLRRDWDNTGTPPGIMRYSAGALTSVRMPVRAGQRAGVFEIAPIPGTNSAWAVGAFLNNGALGSATAVIMKTAR